MKFLLGIYDYLKGHGRVLWSSLVALTLVFGCLVFKLDFSEDISDFLPLGTSQREAFSVYQKIAGADRMFVLFSNPDDEDLTVRAMDCFSDYVHEIDSEGLCEGLQVELDDEQIEAVADFMYANMPYFLDERDYERMENQLRSPGFVKERLETDARLLMFPSGSIMERAISRDPLSLFLPKLRKLQDFNPQAGFNNIDGHIFTPDMSRAVAMMTSPFGGSETSGNTRLVKLLNKGIDHMNKQYPQIEAHLIGGPAIAVGNARRIKTDSVVAILLSLVLIVMLLAYSFNSLRNILLILLSISWGWLFAMGGMALWGNSVSIIVIGISSVILGIAVNYPLHLIAHLDHQSDIRKTISEIAAPLVVGNITTVGAFMALVPLQSTSLRDLGAFAALLLVGTIIFVLVYLPHFVQIKKGKQTKRVLLDRVAAWSPDRSLRIVGAVGLATLILGAFSTGASFDDNLANINYMTSRQRDDMAYFQKLVTRDSLSALPVYVLSSGKDFDEALQKNSTRRHVIDSLTAAGVVCSHTGMGEFITSSGEQTRRLGMFREFVERNSDILLEQLPAEASREGFSEQAFAPFYEMIHRAGSMQAQDISYFEPLTSTVFSANMASLNETGRDYVVDRLSVMPENVDKVRAAFDSSFEVSSMNSALTRSLSDNFNYIGWACSLIVFIFLWFSFGRIELALIAFLPMAVSWLWILGLMSILGIKFNIVNIILATFIFGQGDDYTIFMTEGCQHEYTFRRPILSAYKSSILQSALIMFVGMGTLIVARHPAMRSLAEVTIIGMSSVVFMAWLIPPFMFRWITTKNGLTRRYPLTLRSFFCGVPKDPVSLVEGRFLYKGMSISRTVHRNLKDRKAELQTMTSGPDGSICIEDRGYGECAIFAAISHPDAKITALMQDSEKARIAEIAATDFANNIEFKLDI